jgi:hypothetical protein
MYFSIIEFASWGMSDLNNRTSLNPERFFVHMSVRKTILLKKIISNFATPTQLQRYNELAQSNKGSSTHFALRAIERYFEKQQEKVPTIHENSVKPSRTIKVNGYGKSWIQEL